jgi:hypothetical protein
VVVLALVVAQTCQQAQVRITQEQAIATAREEIRFTPEIVNVRLLRQGLRSKPYWFVNMSTRARDDETVRNLVVVQVDANNGEVVDVDRQR